jgi:hypothetical protein
MFPSEHASSAASILGPPPRTLTPALDAFCGKASAGKIRWWVLGFMLLIVVPSVTVPMCYVNRTLDNVQSQFPMVNMPMPMPQGPVPGWPTVPGQPTYNPMNPMNPYAPAAPTMGAFDWARNMMWGVGGSIIGMFVFVIVVIVLVMKLLGKGKQKKRRFVLEHGQVGNATVMANLIDYSIQINGAPRRTVQMNIDGHAVEFSTFDHNFANLFPQGETLEVVWHPQAPDATMPTAMLPLG